MNKIFSILLIMVCSTAHAEMFKCISKDGKAKYQATKCPSDTDVKVIPNADKVNPVEALKSKIQAANASVAVKMLAAIKDHVVIPGMTTAQALESIGSPTNINHSQYGDSHDEQWVYRKVIKTGKYSSIDKTSYVYFKSGILTSVQWSQ